MPLPINWNIAADTGSGQSNFTGTASADAYLRVNRMVAPGVSDQIDLLPGAAGEIRLFALQLNGYDPAVQWQVNGGAALPLTGPVAIAGDVLSALGAAAPNTVTIVNNSAADVWVDIWLMRNV